MFGSLGIPELIFIFALALLIFGPRKLPEIGRTIGRGLSEFRKASTDLKRSINSEMIEEEMRQADPRTVLEEPSSQGTARDDPDATPSASGASGTAGEEPPSSAEPKPSTPPAGSVPRSAPGEATSDGAGAGEAQADSEAP